MISTRIPLRTTAALAILLSAGCGAGSSGTGPESTAPAGATAAPEVSVTTATGEEGVALRVANLSKPQQVDIDLSGVDGAAIHASYAQAPATTAATLFSLGPFQLAIEADGQVVARWYRDSGYLELVSSAEPASEYTMEFYCDSDVWRLEVNGNSDVAPAYGHCLGAAGGNAVVGGASASGPALGGLLDLDVLFDQAPETATGDAAGSSGEDDVPAAGEGGTPDDGAADTDEAADEVGETADGAGNEDEPSGSGGDGAAAAEGGASSGAVEASAAGASVSAGATAKAVVEADHSERNFSDWPNSGMVAGGQKPYSQQVVEWDGNQVARFEVREGQAGPNKKVRSEVGDSTVDAGSEWWYSWRTQIPGEWKDNDSTWYVTTQFHQAPPKWRNGDWGPPPLKFGYSGGQWHIHQWFYDGDHPKGPLYEAAGAKGVWVNWRVHAVWSGDGKGVLQIWRDDKLVVDRRGKNLNGDGGGGTFFKLGIYRGHGDPNTQVVLHDDYRRGRTRQSVD
jgi:hypothetical protein